MIYLLHGSDALGIHREIAAIKQRLQVPVGELDANTVVLDGARITPQEFMQHATTLPFMAPAKLIIVEGLVGALSPRRRTGSAAEAGADDTPNHTSPEASSSVAPADEHATQDPGVDVVPAGQANRKASDPLERWRPVVAQLKAAGSLPETTTIVFAEGSDVSRGAAFKLIAEMAKPRAFDPPREKELPAWVRAELETRNLDMTPRAVAALCEAVGNDLWAIYNELDKLETFAPGSTIDEAVVAEIVPQAREAKLWDLTDAVAGGDERKAIRALAKMLDEGEPAPLLASMIARQFRQLCLVKELRDARAPVREIAAVASVPEWKASAISDLAGRYTWTDLRRAYGLLVDADLAVKRGQQDADSSLQLLVHELCALAPKASQQRPSAARPRGR